MCFPTSWLYHANIRREVRDHTCTSYKYFGAHLLHAAAIALPKHSQELKAMWLSAWGTLSVRVSACVSEVSPSLTTACVLDGGQDGLPRDIQPLHLAKSPVQGATHSR
ncbi:hypothetical protein V8C44DRAFT_321025 [Trichoderma aethiopicum]